MDKYNKLHMDEELPPTELTIEDIDRAMAKMTNCTSCDKHMAYVLTDYYTGQCQQCFDDRKPWLSTSPVRGAYFQVSQ